MNGCTHRGILRTNGFVDTSESTDLTRLMITPSDDGFHLGRPEIGDFEWWYFDLFDTVKECVLKVVAHIGTDPLRRTVFPQLAVSFRAPFEARAFQRRYAMDDLRASEDHCDVRLGEDCHIRVAPSGNRAAYRLEVKTPDFGAGLVFTPEIPGWNPLGGMVEIARKTLGGTFSWIIPVPRARVKGGFRFGDETYLIEDALGYHDHNYWRVNRNSKLFMDDIITGWYWGRFLGTDHTVIFMATRFKTHSIRSLMISRDKRIVSSSNNLMEILVDELRKDEQLKVPYPSKVLVRSLDRDNPFSMTIHFREIVEKKDLLEGLPGIARWLIKGFVAKPVYFGLLGEARIRGAYGETSGPAVYEMMLFRKF